MDEEYPLEKECHSDKTSCIFDAHGHPIVIHTLAKVPLTVPNGNHIGWTHAFYPSLEANGEVDAPAKSLDPPESGIKTVHDPDP